MVFFNFTIPPGQECVWSKYGVWSECSQSCGRGRQIRSPAHPVSREFIIKKVAGRGVSVSPQGAPGAAASPGRGPALQGRQ